MFVWMQKIALTWVNTFDDILNFTLKLKHIAGSQAQGDGLQIGEGTDSSVPRW